MAVCLRLAMPTRFSGTQHRHRSFDTLPRSCFQLRCLLNNSYTDCFQPKFKRQQAYIYTFVFDLVLSMYSYIDNHHIIKNIRIEKIPTNKNRYSISTDVVSSFSKTKLDDLTKLLLHVGCTIDSNAAFLKFELYYQKHLTKFTMSKRQFYENKTSSNEATQTIGLIQ